MSCLEIDSFRVEVARSVSDKDSVRRLVLYAKPKASKKRTKPKKKGKPLAFHLHFYEGEDPDLGTAIDPLKLEVALPVRDFGPMLEVLRHADQSKKRRLRVHWEVNDCCKLLSFSLDSERP